MLKLPPINKEIISQAVQEIIDQTGQPLFFEYILDRVLCTTCGGDDPFCLTCGGNRYITPVEQKEYVGKVVWKDSQRKTVRKTGWQEISGDCQVTVWNDGLLEQTLLRCKKVRIGNDVLYIQSYHFGGLDNNRWYINLTYSESTNGVRIG